MATKNHKKDTSAATDAFVTLQLETPDGENTTVKAKIADGFPTVRPLKGQNLVVKSADLMSLATGKKLSEDTQKVFTQLGFGKEDAISFVEDLVLKGSAMAKIEESKSK
jgi:hypothetical protein